MSRKHATFVTLVAGFALAGCGAFDKAKSAFGGKSGSKGQPGIEGGDDPNGGDGDETKPQVSPLNLTGALQSFPSCEAVEEYIESRLVKDMQREIKRQIRWIEEEDESVYGRAGSGGGSGAPGDKAANDSAAPEGASDGAESASDNDSGGPKEHTTTNNQVEGVEEGDFVKNTGTHIYHVTKGKLRILKSWPADAMALLSETALDGRPFEMLLDEKGRLVVFSNPKREAKPEDAKPGAKEQVDTGAMALDSAMPWYGGYGDWDHELLDVTVLDVTKPAAPKKLAGYRMKGSYSNVRRVGSAVRVVLQTWRRWPEEVRLWGDDHWIQLPNGDWRPRPKAERIAKLKELMESNRVAIESKDLAYWLETDAYVKMDASGKKTPVLDLGTCQSIHAPTVDTQMGLTRIVTIDLDQSKIAETLLLTHVAEMYASQSSLYLTTPYWWWDDEARDTDFTYIHKFDITSAAGAAYAGSGGVEGMLVNQFAMDEHDDHLRVATTVSKRREGGNRWDLTTVNRVSVMAPNDGALKIVGQTQDLAEGERIYSVRFKGTRGFMVTFRQVDPLYTLDLTDPAKPAVVGELKIPGFSTYIHMIDDDHLLTIGREATEEGRQLGIKLSVFDVKDMAKPKEIHKHVLTGEFWSEAEYQHKAFTFMRSKGLLAIPVTGYRSSGNEVDGYWWGSYVSALKVFKVDLATGIKELGEVDMSDVYAGSARDKSWWFSGARVQRSIFADDYVYAIADLGIRAVRVDDLDQPLSSVRYKCDQTCFNSWWWW